MEHTGWWLKSFLEGFDAEGQEEIRDKVIEGCGRACFKNCGITDTVKECALAAKDTASLIEELNNRHIGGGKLALEGNTITGIYDQCYCPTMKASEGTLPESFCNCTRGWTKELFETALGRPVDVELVQSIRRGDACCKFVVKL